MSNGHLKTIKEKIFEKYKNLEEAYKEWSKKVIKEGKKGIEYLEFKSGLKDLGLHFPLYEVQNVFHFIDENHDGVIDFDEFQNCFITEDEKIESWVIYFLFYFYFIFIYFYLFLFYFYFILFYFNFILFLF